MIEAISYLYAALALVALVLLFWRPVVGLIFLVAIFPMDWWSPRLPVPGMNTETVLLGVAFAMTVLRFGARLPPLRYSGPVIAFVVVMLVSFVVCIPWARDLDESGESLIWPIFKHLKSMSFSVLFFFASYWWLKRPEHRRYMLEAISIGVAIAAVVALLDLALGLTIVGAAGRATGFSNDPNSTAEAVGSMMLVSLYLAMRGRELPRLRRAMHFGIYLVAFLEVVLSLSRGNWIALVAAHAVFFWLVSRPLFLAGTVTVALLATIAFPLLPELVRERVESTVKTGTTVYAVGAASGLEMSAAMRVVFAQIGWDMFKDSPIWGNGLNSFYVRSGEYGAKYGIFKMKDAHNIAVRLAAESGLIGLASLAWLIMAVYLCGRRLYRSDSSERALGAVLLAASTHVLLASFTTDSFLYDKMISGYFWVLYALCARAYVERYAVAAAVSPAALAVPRWRRFSHSTSAAASQL